jgi:hypothetical protein
MRAALAAAGIVAFALAGCASERVEPAQGPLPTTTAPVASPTSEPGTLAYRDEVIDDIAAKAWAAQAPQEQVEACETREYYVALAAASRLDWAGANEWDALINKYGRETIDQLTLSAIGKVAAKDCRSLL